MKDVALSVLFCLFISLLLLYKRQRARSQSELKSLSAKLTQLKSMENHFDDVQKKFEEERRKRQSINEIAENENKQVQTLKSQLLEAERLLENSYSAPLALQPLLRRTCELEMSYISQQRLECIAEMKEAVELIDKLRRKQSSLISSIKLATGASSGTDQIDSKIYSLKARMEKISLAMSECHQRWIEVESLCGFPLMITSDGSGSVIRPSPSNTSSFYRDSGSSK
ncbi:hypothetical protein AB6A40_007283 [Gnathostoma spinigerum]|uniref:STIM1/2 Orai1-activating region domain-containing protein n=1 Tax=Gnathostoma spinigerum TaxID=75299 RepID=A0ABD6EQX9_9BILA